MAVMAAGLLLAVGGRSDDEPSSASAPAATAHPRSQPTGSTGAVAAPGGAAATATAGTTPASTPNGFVPFMLVHAGDPELGSPDLPGTGQRLRRLVDEVNRLRPAMLIIAGDLAHGGKAPAELKALDEALAACQVPVRAVAGNHDDLGAFRKRFGPEYYSFSHANCEFVCLYSEDLSDRQMEWAERALRAAEQAGRTHVIVVVHHPPEPQSRLDKLLAAHKVSAVLAGHLHKTQRIAGSGYPVYVVSGTAKFRDSQGMTYGVVKVEADRVEHQALPLGP